MILWLRNHIAWLLVITFLGGNIYQAYDKVMSKLAIEYYKGIKDFSLFVNCTQLQPYRGELVKLEAGDYETCKEIEGILDKKYHYPDIFPANMDGTKEGK